MSTRGTIIHLFECMFATDQFVDAVGEGHLTKYGRSIVRVEAVLISLRPLALFHKTHVNKLVEVVMKCAVINFECFFEFFRTHFIAMDEPIEDFISGAVADSSVHFEILVETEDALLRQQVCRIVRDVVGRRLRLICCHRVLVMRLMGLVVVKPVFFKNTGFYLSGCGEFTVMSAKISRELVADRLGRVKYDRFLFYLMGPYKSFNLNYVLSEEERREIEIDDLPGPLRRLFQNKEDIDAAQAHLRRVQGELRTDPGVNAFLAIDVEIDTEDIDAVTQSIEYARCSNATTFVVPFLGHNFGIGEEAGSILEKLGDTHDERLIFIHEAAVTSAMIRSASVRWDLRIETYETEAELVSKLRQFAGGIMHRERRGDLERQD